MRLVCHISIFLFTEMSFLQMGEKINHQSLVVMMIEKFGVLDKIKNIKLAAKIIEKYFPDEVSFVIFVCLV